MNAPEHLHYLVSELGDLLVQALSADSHCRDLASQIQSKGYGLVLVLEASPTSATPFETLVEKASREPVQPFSEDDRRLMKSFKIRMD
jgi:hypothetical protein